MLATYSFHNKNTLEYLNLARSRINMLKTMFTIYNAIEIEIEQKTFNKFKFHVLSYYKDFIRKFESTDNWNTKHFEKAHIYRIKIFYPQTNKRIDYIKQIYTYNKRDVNLYAINAILKREKMLNTENSLLKKKITIAYFAEATNL